MQQLQPLRRDLNGQLGYARDVAARPVEAGDETELDRVAAFSNTIGIVVVAAFAASAAGVPVAAITATWRRTRSAANAGNRSVFALRPAIFDRDVLALDIAVSLKPLTEGGQHARVRLGRCSR